MKIEVTRLGSMRRVSHLRHLYRLLLFSPLDKEEERHCNLPEQEEWGAESFWENGSPTSKIPLFINTGAEPPWIQTFTSSKSRFESRIFWHVRSTRFNTFLPYYFIHYEVRIWIINSLAVFTSFQIELRMQRDILTSPFRIHVVPHLPKRGPNQVHSTIFPWSLEKEEAEEHL